MNTVLTHQPQLSREDAVLLTQIMARNGEVPPTASGWVWVAEYAGDVHRPNGVLGEVARSGESVYVCVSGCDVLALPNSHPDCRPSCGTVWVRVPRPADIDWRYVPSKYRDSASWRIGGTA